MPAFGRTAVPLSLIPREIARATAVAYASKGVGEGDTPPCPSVYVTTSDVFAVFVPATAAAAWRMNIRRMTIYVVLTGLCACASASTDAQ